MMETKMAAFQAISILITLAAIFAYFNHRYMKMPMTIGLMMMSLIVAIGLIILDYMGFPVKDVADRMIRDIDFSRFLLDGMLGFLLFAGALHVNLDDLAEHKLEISIYSTLGVLASTLLVGSTIYGLSHWFGLGLRLVDSLLFGALISPTDPIAVLRILKKVGASRQIQTTISGESLFNDGIGVVVFLILLEIVTSGHDVTVSHVALLFAQEAAGGVVFGLAVGYIAYRLLKTVNKYQVEVMLTLALVFGGYSLAQTLHISAPLAMVVAGLLIGNHGRRFAMSDNTREHLDTFWELVDEVLNAVLFVIIGLEVLVLTLRWDYLLAGLFAIPVAIAARMVSIGIPSGIMHRKYDPGFVYIMTWGGLRGGISVALALSLPMETPRELILTITYVVVALSILIQGLTIRGLVKRYTLNTTAPDND